nr:hypothetical protein [uncultured Mucilaginibacter sp.]
MNENTGNSGNDFFYDLLDNPSDLVYGNNTSNLQALINDFPQSGLLRAILAVKREEEDIQSASTYINPHLLYKIANAAGSLTAVTDSQIVFFGKPGEGKPSSSIPQAVDEANYFHVPVETDLVYADEKKGDEALMLDDEPDVEQIQYTETEDSKIGSKPTQPHQEIDDEVFEEIVSIEDIGIEQSSAADNISTNVAADDPEKKEASSGDSYFVFEPAVAEDDSLNTSANIVTQVTPANKGGRHVSRYNDEKMPYSFMWWLDKTRKEHAATYQPFADEGKFHSATVAPAEKQQPVADNLQQQYVENIFAVSSVVNDLNVIPPKTDAQPAETKADKIIEKFIYEEPQIKHPSSVKLNSENKAKKSSEDRNELVTETLAKIYTEQMLYHKAISTYKKLMLKFPEKSLYFAGQIEQLENKIN